jgi:hypothetical protein
MRSIGSSTWLKLTYDGLGLVNLGGDAATSGCIIALHAPLDHGVCGPARKTPRLDIIQQCRLSYVRLGPRIRQTKAIHEPLAEVSMKNRPGTCLSDG